MYCTSPAYKSGASRIVPVVLTLVHVELKALVMLTQLRVHNLLLLLNVQLNLLCVAFNHHKIPNVLAAARAASRERLLGASPPCSELTPAQAAGDVELS